MNKKEIMDINILLAIFKCFSEQLHSNQGRHTGILKMKYNRVLKVVRQYEKEIDKSMLLTGDNSIEEIYDTLMDTIMESRDIVMDNIEKEELTNG